MADQQPPRRLSDELLEAAVRVDEMARPELARLLMKAAVRLRVVQQSGSKLEHIPVASYHLLRRLSVHPIRVVDLHAQADDAARQFLISRELAELSVNGTFLMATMAGNEVGEIANERLWPEEALSTSSASGKDR